MPNPHPGHKILLAELMLLIAGFALGLWLNLPIRRSDPFPEPGSVLVAYAVFALGGLAVVGPPILLWERHRLKRHGLPERAFRPPRWGPGQLLWASSGISAWLLWPPIIRLRTAKPAEIDHSMSYICFFYGTPLMAVYLIPALLFGGWLTPRRRRAARRYWSERFGFWLGLAWFVIGLYLLVHIYLQDRPR